MTSDLQPSTFDRPDAGPTPPPPRPSLRRRLLYAACAVLLVLGGLEGVLRLVGVRPALSAPEIRAALRGLHRAVPGDPVIYTLTPRSVVDITTSFGPARYTINAAGLRGPEVAPEKPAGRRRILLLGDSVTFGFGVGDEDTFAAMLQRDFRTRPNGPRRDDVEVLNTGVGGYNTYNERVFYETRGARFDADVVLLVVCPNDVDNPMFHFDFNTAADLARLPSDAIPDPAAFRRLRDAGWSPPALDASRLVRGVQVARRHSALVTWLVAMTRPDDSLIPDRAHCVRALARADSPESRWFADQVGRLADAARQRGAQLGVVLVPFRWQLADPSDLTKSAAATISKLCARHGLPFLDTTEALSRGGPARVMFFDTFHLTPRGHAAVADALRGWLDQHPELLD